MARRSESADGDALGLLDQQFATLDSPKQAPSSSRSHLRRKLQDREHSQQQQFDPKISTTTISFALTGFFSQLQPEGCGTQDRSHRNCVGYPPDQSAYRRVVVMFRSATPAANTIADNNKKTDVGGSGTPEGDTA
jgi:hypothetical protein